MMEEIFKSIKGFDRYLVSSDGYIKSLGNSTRLSDNKKLRPSKGSSGKGYFGVCLCDGKTRKRVEIHKVVCEAFYGPKPSKKHVVAHNDGNKYNNKASNLRWATQKENALDKYKHGVVPTRENGNHWKLTPKDLDKIFERILAGEQQKHIAKDFNVSRSLICKLYKKFKQNKNLKYENRNS